MDKIIWTQCDSEGDMKSRLSNKSNVIESLVTQNATSWGFLSVQTDHKKCLIIPVNYTDIGLLPKAYVKNGIIFVGIYNIIFGYSIPKGGIIFMYEMPTVFHEIICFDTDSLIIADEIGFVRLSYEGKEIWSQLCEDIVDNYEIKKSSISGVTFEGKSFEFKL